jgi:hypothetical protein
MKTIKLMADYYCHPLWHVSADEFGDIDPSDLPLSNELQAALGRWALTYDATLNMEAPQDSGFPSDALEESFKAEGRRLADCLRQELGNQYVVVEHI